MHTCDVNILFYAEDDETYEKRRKRVWDYEKYQNANAPFGVHDEIFKRNAGQGNPIYFCFLFFFSCSWMEKISKIKNYT